MSSNFSNFIVFIRVKFARNLAFFDELDRKVNDRHGR